MAGHCHYGHVHRRTLLHYKSFTYPQVHEEYTREPDVGEGENTIAVRGRRPGRRHNTGEPAGRSAQPAPSTAPLNGNCGNRSERAGMNTEELRLQEARRKAPWKKWGPT